MAGLWAGGARSAPLILEALRGPRQAIIAVAASVPTTASHLLESRCDDRDLGADSFDHIDRERIVVRHVRRLADLGYAVQLAPFAPAT